MDRGFGFIKGEEEGDLFFHRNDLEGVEFGSLRELRRERDVMVVRRQSR
jgi:cold shock CspA family protein